MQAISIIGAGEIGTAIARLIQRPGFEVELWDKDVGRIPQQKSLEDILPASSIIFLCVPSWAVRSVLSSALPFLPKDAVVVSLAKGIEVETRKTMDQVMEESLPPGTRYALLGGPLLAEELALGMLGIGVIGTKEKATFDQIHTVFDVSILRLEWLDDPHLTALLGVLKNIYAIVLGIAGGLEWGLNAKGWLTALAIREMNNIVQALHGENKNVINTAGIGDFIATAYSPYSRNRKFGQQIVKTGTGDLKSEGCVALPSLIALLGKQASSFPMLIALHQIIFEHQDAKTTFEQLVQKM